MKKSYDFVVIGGGIIGLTLARTLHNLYPSSSLAVLEKELFCGQHASTNNSGVVHAGFYYTPGTIKAMITRKGNQYMSEYCEEHNVGFKRTGKMLVPKNQEDVSNLNVFLEKGIKNGVRCEIISTQDAKEIEPNLVCQYDKVFYSPLTAIADQIGLIKTLVKELKDKKVEIMTDTKFIDRLDTQKILTNKGPLEYNFLINCAGQHADSIANRFALSQNYSIMPVLGVYYNYHCPPSSHKLNTLLYPVPEPEVFFPGAHWNMDLDGNLKIGPSFFPILWREQYSMFENVDIMDMAKNLKNYGKLMLSRQRLQEIKNEKIDFKKRWMYMKLMSHEFAKFRRKTMAREVQNMTGFQINEKNMMFGRPGIMPQLFHNKTNELINDFVIEKEKNSLHVLNAVSPGWTCSFAFAEYIGELVEKSLKEEEDETNQLRI